MKVQRDVLKPGDILDQEIVMPSGRVLMSPGMVLTASMIELLRKKGFDHVLIRKVKSERHPMIDVVFNSENLLNQTMIDFKCYVESREDYFDLIDKKGAN